MKEPREQAEAETAAALAVVREEIDALDGWTIEDAEGSELAAAMLRDVKARTKGLEAKRTAITKPMNAALRAVNALFKPPKAALLEAEKALKGKIAAYLEGQERANAAALAVAGAASTPEAASAALATVAPVAAPGGVSVRYKYTAHVTSEGLVPSAFLSPDLDLIEDYGRRMRAAGKSPDVPGVEWEKSPIVSSRATVQAKIEIGGES